MTATALELVIEYPAQGATYAREEYGVYSYDVFPEGSVLAGQERRRFVDSFPTLEEAQQNFPQAHWTGGGSGYRAVPIPETPPAWFDPAAIGERWSEDD
jgi:hypothetical protein